MANGARGGTDSRLMTWVSAKDTCEALWEEFEAEYRRQVELLIQQARSAFGDSSITKVTVYLKEPEILECLKNFERIWPRLKETALRRLEGSLLPVGKRAAHMGDVWSRSKKNLTTRTSKGSHPRRKKPGRKARNPHARKHVRTGKKKGWPKGKKRSLPGDSKRLAAKRRKRRGLAARLIRRYKWSRELKRHWKAYPRKRDKAG